MKREELDRKFDEALGEALDIRKWNSGAMTAFGVIALAIAVRGLWPGTESEPVRKPIDEQDLLRRTSQGEG